MKLILENWRQYLKEDDEDYDEFKHERSWEDGGPPRTQMEKIISMIGNGDKATSLQAREFVLSLDLDIEEVVDKLVERYTKASQDYKEAEKTWEILKNLGNGMISFLLGDEETEEQAEAVQKELYGFWPGPLDKWTQNLKRVTVKKSRSSLIAYWYKSLEQEGADETNI
tara:strand:- start:2590 stop:3096 length:507 start_codon:yes stop_codon:yes gene_type:complete